MIVQRYENMHMNIFSIAVQYGQKQKLSNQLVLIELNLNFIVCKLSRAPLQSSPSLHVNSGILNKLIRHSKYTLQLKQCTTSNSFHFVSDDDCFYRYKPFSFVSKAFCYTKLSRNTLKVNLNLH